jgi:uncharacterized delta-60 repeat protein
VRRSDRRWGASGTGARRRQAWSLLAGLLLALAPVAASAAPGDLDITFGVGGVVTTNFGGTYDWAYATALQPDGKIVAAGVSNAKGTYDFALARYRPDHTLDPSFGDGGIVTTDFGQSYDWAYSLVLQPDGKMVVGGVSDVGGSKGFALARYRTDGRLDRSFGHDGLLDERLPSLSTDVIHGLALQPDGRIVAAGVTFEDRVTLQPQGDFMLSRYLPDGQTDPSFGVGGMVKTDFEGGSYDEPYAVVLQRDGRIVVAGYTTNAPSREILFGADNLAVARYTNNGLLDETFGRRGKAVLDAGSLDEEFRSVALAADGKIVAAGFTNGERRGDMLVARFTRDGILDQGFGLHQGYTVTDFGSRSERLSSLVIQPDGRIVAGGQVALAEGTDFAVVRYDSEGRLDPSFGRGGLAMADFRGREDRVQAVALQPDGKVVAVGISEADFAVARFNGS